MPTIGNHLAWLDAIMRRVHEFADRGGDLNSLDAMPLGVALLLAIAGLASAMGYQGWDPQLAIHNLDQSEIGSGRIASG
jgi:hypothetical protein